jgi:hypothetical protein
MRRKSVANLNKLEFVNLLDAYVGARDHAQWCRDSGQPQAACEAAKNAATEARRELIKAVCE